MTSGGRSISDRKSKAFKWMAAHAGTYGFVNLPSEPWHWSITGS
jgi:D-alanyl-D-alanine carboxypeptidase